MSRLLTGDLFTNFLMQEASITTYCNHFISGSLYPDFYDKEEWEASDLRSYRFVPWDMIRPTCLDLIKGKHTPLDFRFTLCLKPELAMSLLTGSSAEQASSPVQGQEKRSGIDSRTFILNIRFDDQGLSLTTATASAVFDLDHTPESLWDQYVLRFLEDKSIPFSLG